MRRVRDARMVQTRDEIPDPLRTLYVRLECQTATAIDAFLRNQIRMIHRIKRARDRDRSDGARQVAHVIAAHQIVLIADALRMDIAAREHQTRGLESTCREHEVFCARRQALPAQRLNSK